MKKFIALLLAMLTLLASCGPVANPDTTLGEEITDAPTVTEPAKSEPEETDPTETEPEATEPTVTDPVVTEPAATEPIVTEPIVTEPVVTEPAETEPPVKVQRDDFTIKVKDDTYVVNKDGNGDQYDNSFSAEEIIDVKTSGPSLTRYGYVKFDISELVGNNDFTCVDLDLYVSWRQKDEGNPEYATIEIYACDPTWEGKTLTFNTQPTAHKLVSSLDDITDARTSRSFPITSYIKQALESEVTEVAFFIKENTPKVNLRTQFFSKESGEKAPKLSVYHGTKVDETTVDEPVIDETVKEDTPLEAEPEISKNGLDSIVGLNKVDIVKIDVAEDTYVEAGTSADTNFGKATHLEFKASYGSPDKYYRITLLKFDISRLKEMNFASVQLSLLCTAMEDPSVPTPIKVYECFPTDWEEMTVTFNMLPERGKHLTDALVTGLGEIRIDVTDYVRRMCEAGMSEISFYLEGDTKTIRRLNFASKEGKDGMSQLIVGDSDGKINTYLQYTGVNPWEYAMENVSDWMNRWEKIKKNEGAGVETIAMDSSEYSLSVGATRTPNGVNTQYTDYPTRNVSTLKGYTANTSETAKYDVYGGLMDESMKQEATGFFYTKKIGGRWWTIDPLGYPFYRTAVVAIVLGSPNQRKNVWAKYATADEWAEATTDRLRELGYNSTGGWSATKELINADQPLAQTGILYVLKNYCQANRLDVSNSGSTDLLYGLLPVFDPAFVDSARATVKEGVKGYETSKYIYGWMGDNELPAALSMLEASLTLDTTDPRFIYSYATAWTFMYLKTGKTEIYLTDVTDELRKEYRAMVYDRYFKVVCDALERYAPYHQFMGCRFIDKAFKDEYVMRVAGNWCDVISYNYYGAWEADSELIANQQKWADKPFIITEWYAKGMDVWEKDNRMTNASGAGWTVKDQNDRGRFYQNFALKLLECKGCVGFDWFQYLDNDPDDQSADLSNTNANKGVIDNRGEEYTELTKYMAELNNQKYNLVKFFDAR